jgi:hypothetical protein
MRSGFPGVRLRVSGTFFLAYAGSMINQLCLGPAQEDRITCLPRLFTFSK